MVGVCFLQEGEGNEFVCILYHCLSSAESLLHLNAVLQQPECRLIFEKLRTGLPAYVHYHTLQHTLDVCGRTAVLCQLENVPVANARLLIIAAAYHDSGYLQQAVHHEAVSCTIVQNLLPDYQYSPAEIQTICSIIMATRLPQEPQGHLQQIICDADLDYLGRKDFWENSYLLYQERLQQGLVADERDWNRQQVDFLKNHHYFTATATTQRSAQKATHLSIIEQKLIEP